MDNSNVIILELKKLLSDFNNVGENTEHVVDQEIIDYTENPLTPPLLAYCFRNILGFNVNFRIAEKVNYIIEFDYEGTYAVAEHKKLSYRMYIDRRYKEEIIELLKVAKMMLQQLYTELGEKALQNNQFYMRNETIEYFEKFEYLEDRIEQANIYRDTITEKLSGKYDKRTEENITVFVPKGANYLHKLNLEIYYNIETYIDTFYSALEHVMTLLFPFTTYFTGEKSYYSSYIRDTRWSWDKKVEIVCGRFIPDGLYKEMKRIKEVYRNHNAHGAFSREMMAYVNIPDFGSYPMYIGKKYLKGFIDNVDDKVSFETYINVKKVFTEFWTILRENYEIPMMFINSGLPIPVDTQIYMDSVRDRNEAEMRIEKLWYDIDNQSNMDW